MFKKLLAGLCATLVSAGAQAATFSDQTTFLSELDTHTLIDTSAHIGSTTSAIPVTGGSFFGPNALVRSDDLILNGLGFHGATTPHVGINFDGVVTAVGITSNAIDGGRIQLWSGLNGTGTLLSETGFGGSLVDAFTGVIGPFTARSVIFTCDFNFDLKCGLRDPIFGFVNDQVAGAVPLPASGLLLLGAAGGAAVFGRRRKA